MKEIYKHFIFTRVNLGYKDRIGKINKDLFNEKSWLNYRFEIFFRTCLPSIINQKDQNFLWYIYLDSQTPIKYINELKDKISDKDNFIVELREGGFGSLLDHSVNSIKEYGIQNFEYLITTRIDSDDMIHQDYISDIQANFNYQKYVSINFNRGLVYDLRSKMLGTAINKSNPFITVIEKVESENSFKTVFHQEHSKFIFEKERVEIKSRKRMWVMTIHDLNINTNFYGNPILFQFSALIEGFQFNFINNAPNKLKTKYKLIFYKKQFKKVLPFLLKKINRNG